MRSRIIAGLARLSGLIILITVLPVRAQSNQTIYADSLSSGWVGDWSWAAVNFANTSPVHSGADSISVTADAWEALFLHSNVAFDPAGYTNLSFWINGGSSGGQLLQVQAVLDGTAVSDGIQLAALAKTSWQQVNAPMSSLIPAGQTQINGFWIQDRSGTTQGTFYVDDIALEAGPVSSPGTNAAVAVTVDALANRHPISPLIYGVAFASSNELAGLNFTLNRSGGNAETRYNWQLNTHNHGADWYFESIPDDGPANAGATADAFVADSKNGGAQAMITIPMIGWMPKLSSSRGKLASYSIATYGPQTGNDSSWMPDAGNGISVTNDTAITWNEPTDANFQTNSAFQRGYVQHLISRWGASTNGGVRYYFMDNEHSIWYSTHQDVHPVGPTMQEIRDKWLDYAGMVKTNDPNALVLGPEEWGWSGYFYSGYDLQNSGYTDRANNGGWDYMPWLLNQLHQHDTNAGQRLLDYFTLHCYPQGGEFSDDVSTSRQLLRNQSTRQFWDTNYVDQSWIGQQATNNILKLIPRMKNWVATCYPGTPIGITEYNWGAESHINGATAQADLLGIFGREGLDLATRWTTPATNTPVYNAMKLYRNYDGNKSAFGDVSVAATVPAPDSLSAFAAIRTNDSALTVMVINKTLSGLTPLSLNVTNFANSGTAQAWQLASANVITRLADVPYTNGVLSNTLPVQSITLFVLPTDKNLRLRVGTNAPVHQLDLWMDGEGGQSYILQSSTNLAAWTAVSTNTFVSNSFRVVVGTTNSIQMFYRGLLNSP
jgi:hypothetical protein